MIRSFGTLIILIAGVRAFGQGSPPIIDVPRAPVVNQAPVVLDLAAGTTWNPATVAQTAAEIDQRPCETKDLNVPEETSPLTHIPIYDQDGTGACYAYVASQLLDYERMMKFQERNPDGDLKEFADENRISPLWTAYSAQYASKVNKQTISLSQGGNVEDAIDSLKKTGVCTDQKVQRSLSRLKAQAAVPGEKPITDAQLVWMTDRIHMYTLRPGSEQGDNGLNVYLDNCNVNRFRSFYTAAGADKIAPIYLFDFMFGKCDTDRLRIRNALSTRRTGSDADMEDAVADKFKDNRPAAVNLCEDVLRDPSRRGLNKVFRLRDATGNKNNQCGGGNSLHSVLLVGQKKINGQCNYLVRNSWGANWAPRGATACSCRRNNGRYDDNCNPNDPRDKSSVNEYVGCWYKRSDLLPNIGVVNGY